MANPPPGATPAIGGPDPFLGPSSGPLRYASFDTDNFSLYSSNSPSHAKRALEAHLKDTDRRIQDASRLGTTLLQQRKELTARLRDVEQVQEDDEVPVELRTKLSELEKEYNELGKESARAFLPKSRVGSEAVTSPAVFTAQARESPTKVSAPSRRQRNQPSNRVHDIEFATEISTSLLAQVRQLQTALAEKDDTLKDTTSAHAQLESEVANMSQRIKQMDDSEQRYKDENWNLEMKLQEVEGGLRETTDKHDRLQQSLKSTQSERTAAQRELDDLRTSHEKLSDDHAVVKKQQESELNGLRRDATTHLTEKQALQKKIAEITAQNTELAKAVSYRWAQSNQATDSEFVSAAEDRDDTDRSPEHSEPSSPVKATPRHGMLESETLKSSLNHAHRMIQNLKNNIHREKTEKLELKRMLQDARDELEARRSETGVGANMAKKRRSEPEGVKFKRPTRPDRLGANRSSTTEIMEDEPDWEDHDDERTPSRNRVTPFTGVATLSAVGGAHYGVDGRDTESTDSFDTANERGLTTETEAFETSNEGLAGDDSDLTETEGAYYRTGSVREAVTGPSPLPSSISTRDRRRSLESTASTSADEAEEIRTPVQNLQPKYRLRVNRGVGARRSGHVSDLLSADSPNNNSPASSNGTPQPTGQSLGDELDAMSEEDEGTPGRLSEAGIAALGTPRLGSTEPEAADEPEDETLGAEGGQGEGERQERTIGSPFASPFVRARDSNGAVLAHQANAAMLAHESTTKKASYVDAGVMTEPWEPETEAGATEKQTILDKAGAVFGGALAGFGLGRVSQPKDTDVDDPVEHEEVRPGTEGSTNVALSDARRTSAETVAPVEREAGQPDVVPSDLPHAIPEPRPVAEERLQESRRAAELVAPPQLLEINNEPKSLSSSVLEPLSAIKAAEASAHPEASATTLQHSTVVSQETEPVSPRQPRPLSTWRLPEDIMASSGLQHRADAGLPIPAMSLIAAAAPLAAPAAEKQLPPPQELGFSSIEAQDFTPSALPRRPIVPRRSSRRLDAMFDLSQPTPDGQELPDDLIPGTKSARPGAGFFATGGAPPLVRTRSVSMPASKTESTFSRDTLPSILSTDTVTGASGRTSMEPKVFGGIRQGANEIPTLVFGESDEEDVPVTHSTITGPFSDMPADFYRDDRSGSSSVPRRSLAPGSLALSERSVSSASMIPLTKPLHIKRQMTDEGSQTMVSGDEIDDMIRDKSRTSSMATSMTDTGVSPIRIASPTGQRRSSDGIAFADPIPSRGPRRPASAGNMRTKSGVSVPPPLPDNFTQKITAAAQKRPTTPLSGMPATMGPPLMPASAYRTNKPRTPGDRANERSMSRDGTTPRPVRHRDGKKEAASPSVGSRRASVSSFASELDERFNITRGDLIYPSDVTPATDPRMIQAITQTMIGEYLWKYTRKAGRSETSTTRHRRFFWVHPYTRTLYWSERDPSTAGRNMLKAKSVAIQSVRVITDDNTYPPGLHRKSLVVVTPGREIVFTAPTGQRHETWFNALSYLLLRTEQEKAEADDNYGQEDLEDFNPGFSIRRSISRMTGGRSRSQSRMSASSYRSRTTRTTSPQKRQEGGGGGSLAQRQSAIALRQTATTPTPAPPNPQDTASTSGRFSSMSGRLQPGTTTQRGSFSSKRGRSSFGSRSGRNTMGDPSEIYDASVVDDSAEDLRTVMERQERDADRLENVRACCDGKHDVGSLSRAEGRLSSMKSRFGGHSHPRAESVRGSIRADREG